MPACARVRLAPACAREEQQKAGKVIPFEEFQKAFGDRVAGIGQIVAMMSPWRDPAYLKRVWRAQLGVRRPPKFGSLGGQPREFPQYGTASTGERLSDIYEF